MKTESRIGYDFSKHELTVTKTENAVVYKFKRPDTIQGATIFINSNGIMAVTGDWGNWIFCREFHPSADGGVSDSYWREKLRIASTQSHENYSPQKTRAEIEERLKEEDLDAEDKAYLTDLLDHVDDEEESYSHYAYENMPRDFDAESLPLCYENKFWLKAIFDAFDEICARIAVVPIEPNQPQNTVIKEGGL